MNKLSVGAPCSARKEYTPRFAGSFWWEPPASAGGSWTLVQRKRARALKWALAPEAVFSLIFALLFGCFLFASPVHAAGRAECRSVPSKILGRNVAYCVLLPPSYDADKTHRYPVLYFLHGLGENEQVLPNSGGWNLIQDLWDEKRIGEFLIVTPDGG